MAKNPAAVALGKLGGAARTEALTPEERSEIARKAGLAAQANVSQAERKRRIAKWRKSMAARKKAQE